jgi:hypothetical protein
MKGSFWLNCWLSFNSRKVRFSATKASFPKPRFQGATGRHLSDKPSYTAMWNALKPQRVHWRYITHREGEHGFRVAGPIPIGKRRGRA